MNKLYKIFTLLVAMLMCSFGFQAVQAQCADVGTVDQGTVASHYCLGSSAASDIAVDFSTAPSGNDDFGFAITSEETGFIVGVSEADGSFDFDAAGLSTGGYCFTGFSYNQSDLDQITNNAVVQGILPLNGGENLAELLAIVNESTFGPVDVAGVLGVLDLIPTVIPGFTPCVEVNRDGAGEVASNYCLTVSNDPNDCSVGIEETRTFNGVQNSPNPFSDMTTVSFDLTKNETVAFNVYDLTGKNVYSRNIDARAGNNAFDLDASAFNQGVYFYSISNGTDTVTRKMVVK